MLMIHDSMHATQHRLKKKCKILSTTRLVTIYVTTKSMHLACMAPNVCMERCYRLTIKTSFNRSIVSRAITLASPHLLSYIDRSQSSCLAIAPRTHACHCPLHIMNALLAVFLYLALTWHPGTHASFF